jgi:hypothetical protein
MRQMMMGLVLVLTACADAPSTENAGAVQGEPAMVANTDDPAPSGATNVAVPVSSLVVALSGDGLQLVDGESGKTYPIAFGTAQQQTLDSIAKARGAATETGDNGECGAGPIFYAIAPGQLTLVFQEQKFAGWSIGSTGDAKLTTISGIGIGSKRSALEAAYQATVEESTIGTEFLAGGISGLFDGKGPDAKITDIWAGVTCIAR